MIPRIVHQVYGIFDDGIPLEDIKEYKDAVDQTELYCFTNNIKYKMWSKKLCEELLVDKYPEYIDLYNEFRYDIQRADFIRYIIIYEYGGIYIDCDMFIKNNNQPYDLFEKDYFFVINRKGRIYNAVFGSYKNNNIFKLILNEIEISIIKQEDKIYDKWKGRLVFQTTGEHMLKRVLKNDINLLTDIIDTKGKDIKKKDNTKYFEDYNCSLWYEKMLTEI